jgi:hypothetical protein
MHTAAIRKKFLGGAFGAFGPFEESGFCMGLM